MTDLRRRATLGLDARAFWRHYSGYHRAIMIAGSVSMVAAMAELITLAILATATSLIGERKGTYEFSFAGVTGSVSVGQLLGVATVLVIARGALKLLDTQLGSSLGSRYEYAKRQSFVEAFLASSWPMQSVQRSNELQHVVTGSVGSGRIALKSTVSALGAVVSAVVMLAGSFLISWVATLASLVLAVLLSVGLQPIVRRSKSIGARVRDGSLHYFAVLGETITMSREIRLSDTASEFETRLDGISHEIRDLRTREQFLFGAAPIVFETGALLIVLGGFGALHLFDIGNTTRFVAMLLILLRASQYGRSLQGSYHQMKASMPDLELVDQREAELRSAVPPSGTRRLQSFSHVDMAGVSYSYDESHDALRDVSIAIQAGEVVGFIGPSGSGKSTLVEMLLGLRFPTAGTILINGIDIREVLSSDLHRLTGLVSQEPQLIEGDLIENIRFFRGSITDNDIAMAVEASGLGRDLSSLPEGLHTRIGTRSSGLSGGQRQRLAIARVLAGRPEFLVLDEPTSSLDVHSEEVITETLERLKGSVTIVVVAHRLSTLRVCDKVLVLRNGKAEAFASRADLERDNDYYNSAIQLAALS